MKFFAFLSILSLIAMAYASRPPASSQQLSSETILIGEQIAKAGMIPPGGDDGAGGGSHGGK